jgi:predicted nucleic acid-binding protein
VVALKAEVIITGDKSLKEVKDYMGIKIMPPRQFLENYGFL